MKEIFLSSFQIYRQQFISSYNNLHINNPTILNPHKPILRFLNILNISRKSWQLYSEDQKIEEISIKKCHLQFVDLISTDFSPKHI